MEKSILLTQAQEYLIPQSNREAHALYLHWYCLVITAAEHPTQFAITRKQKSPLIFSFWSFCNTNHHVANDELIFHYISLVQMLVMGQEHGAVTGKEYNSVEHI